MAAVAETPVLQLPLTMEGAEIQSTKICRLAFLGGELHCRIGRAVGLCGHAGEATIKNEVHVEAESPISPNSIDIADQMWITGVSGMVHCDVSWNDVPETTSEIGSGKLRRHRLLAREKFRDIIFFEWTNFLLFIFYFFTKGQLINCIFFQLHTTPTYRMANPPHGGELKLVADSCSVSFLSTELLTLMRTQRSPCTRLIPTRQTWSRSRDSACDSPDRETAMWSRIAFVGWLFSIRRYVDGGAKSTPPSISGSSKIQEIKAYSSIYRLYEREGL